MVGNRLDIVGQTFERLTVVRRVENYISPKGVQYSRWLCECSCGVRKEVTGCNLTSGVTKSCGCLNREINLEKNTKLGMSRTRFYRIWGGMKNRCNNPSNKKYHIYGGRGISYDIKWENFKGFYEDMFSLYEDPLTLDRIDVNGNYNKNNCRWVTIQRQNQNLRKSKRNTTGKTGVQFHKVKGVLKGYSATWSSGNGKARTKTFSLSKYGKEQAFRLACEYRDNQIKLLNEQGAGYTDNHGN